MRICVAGAAGAFGVKHLDALEAIDGVEVVSVVGGKATEIEALAAKRGIAARRQETSPKRWRVRRSRR